MANHDFVKEFSEDLLDKLDIQASVSVTEEGEATYVTLEGDDLGGVIGHHGETLNSLQYLLNLAASNKLGDEYKRIIVDAGQWRKSRQEQLEQMAERAIDRVVQSGNDYHFPSMNAFERRLIHEYISTNSKLITESMGENNDRHIVLKSA